MSMKKEASRSIWANAFPYLQGMAFAFGMFSANHVNAVDADKGDFLYRKEVVYSLPRGAASADLENMITHAIRDTFLSTSTFGPYEQKGLKKGGLLGMGEPMLVAQGIVMQIPYPPSFQVKYQITHTQRSSGFSMSSYTTCDVRLEAIVGSAGHYLISVGPLEEKVYNTTLWHLDALAPKDKIAADVVQVMDAVPLKFNLTQIVTDEFEVPTPAKPTARKYLDALGTATITTHKDETGLRPEENDHVSLNFESLRIGGSAGGFFDFLPTANGTRISARYNIPYAVTPDGNSTYSADEISNFVKQVRDIASTAR